MKNFGKFITFEGIDGMGKSTALQFFAKGLEAKEISYITTREPGGTSLGEDIRNLLLIPREQNISPMSELLMMFAARAEHLDKCILPSLNKGYWVLCDRFTDASFAYQGGGRNMNMQHIALLENLVQQELTPNCTILLDGPIELGFSRAKKRGTLDRFEQEKIDFFQKVRHTYQVLAKKYSNRFQIIDATQTLEAVEQNVLRIMESCLST